jgi:hypothetical protein
MIFHIALRIRNCPTNWRRTGQSDIAAKNSMQFVLTIAKKMGETGRLIFQHLEECDALSRPFAMSFPTDRKKKRTTRQARVWLDVIEIQSCCKDTGRLAFLQ